MRERLRLNPQLVDFILGLLALDPAQRCVCVPVPVPVCLCVFAPERSCASLYH